MLSLYPLLICDQIGTRANGTLATTRSKDAGRVSGNSTHTICYKCVQSSLLLTVQLLSKLKSFTLGRPPSFTLAHVDCKKPYTEDPCNEETCKSKLLFLKPITKLVSSPLVEAQVHVRMHEPRLRPSVRCQDTDVQHRPSARSQVARLRSSGVVADSRLRQLRVTSRPILRERAAHSPTTPGACYSRVE